MARCRRTVRRSLLAALLVALTLSGVLVATGVVEPAAAANADTTVGAASRWLIAELDAGGGHLDHLGGPDWGLTADAVIALAAVDGGGDAGVRAAAANLLAARDRFATWDDVGPEFTGVLLAGPVAKLLLVAQLSDATTGQQQALEDQLRGLIVAEGPQAGRVADRNPYDVDSSSTFTESLAVAALSRSSGGVPSAVVTHLLAQQCPAGGFRLGPQVSPCADDAVIDSDATALVVQALLVAPRSAALDTALSKAVGWLLAAQSPTGSFNGTGPTAVPNANSTALAAQALRGAGQSAAADRAAGWLEVLQRPDTVSDGGAIAYDPGAADAALAGIPPLARDQWRRATAQAMLAFGAPVLGAIGIDNTPATTTSIPTSILPTTTTSVATPTTSVATATTTVAPPTTTVAPPTTTVAPPTTTVAPPTTTSTTALVPVASSSTSTGERVDVLAASDVAPGTSGAAALPRTGLDPSVPLGVALICLGLGGLASVTATRFRGDRVRG